MYIFNKTDIQKIDIYTHALTPMGCELAAVSFADLDCLLGITWGAAILDSEIMKMEKTKNKRSYIDSDKNSCHTTDSFTWSPAHTQSMSGLVWLNTDESQEQQNNGRYVAF